MVEGVEQLFGGCGTDNDEVGQNVEDLVETRCTLVAWVWSEWGRVVVQLRKCRMLLSKNSCSVKV